MNLQPRRAVEPFDWTEVLTLIRREFAYMEGRIDPPSSMARMSTEDLAEQARQGEIWVIGSPAMACMVLTPKGDALYLGRLAVDRAARGKGFARTLVEVAVDRARTLGFLAVELQVRVELTDNQRAFEAMGFRQTNATSHPGYDRVTSLTYRRSV